MNEKNKQQEYLSTATTFKYNKVKVHDGISKSASRMAGQRISKKRPRKAKLYNEVKQYVLLILESPNMSCLVF